MSSSNNVTIFSTVLIAMVSTINFLELVPIVIDFLSSFLFIDDLLVKLTKAKSNNDKKKIINAHISVHKSRFILLRVVNTATLINDHCIPYMFSFIVCVSNDERSKILIDLFKRTSIVFEDIKSHEVYHKAGYMTKCFHEGELIDVYMYDKSITSLNLFDYHDESLFKIKNYLRFVRFIDSDVLDRLCSLGFNITEKIHGRMSLMEYLLTSVSDNCPEFILAILEKGAKVTPNDLCIFINKESEPNKKVLDVIEKIASMIPDLLNDSSSRYNQTPLEFCINRRVDFSIIKAILPYIKYSGEKSKYYGRIFNPYEEILLESRVRFDDPDFDEIMQGFLNAGFPVLITKPLSDNLFHIISDRFMSTAQVHYDSVLRSGRSNEIPNFVYLKANVDELSRLADFKRRSYCYDSDSDYYDSDY